MALVTVQRKKQQNLIAIFVAVVLITLGVLYIGRLKNKGIGQETPQREAGGEISGAARQLKLDTSILTDERFLNLVPYETLSRDIKTGRTNPFAPY